VADGEDSYDVRASSELRALLRGLDAVEEGLEAELAADALTIEFPDGSCYMLHSHRAARQLWLAADHSAWHFDWDPRRSLWVEKKTGDELRETMARILGSKLGVPIKLGS
jgi:CyaY protein